MKIIFVNRYFHPDHSATSQMLSDLAFYLADHGIQVQVICSRQLYGDPGAKLVKLENVGNVLVRRIATTSFGRAWLPGRLLDFASFYISSFFRMLIDVKRGDVLVAKTDPPMISVVCAVITKLKFAKQVNWIQDLFPEVAVALKISGLHGWPYSLLKRVRNWSLGRADANIVLGKKMRDLLLDRIDNPGSLTIIHNWADGDGIAPVRSEDNRLRAQWGLAGKFVLGYSGNMGRAHQFDTILDLAETVKDVPDIVFLFIGAGAMLDWIKSEARQRGLKNIQFRNYQPRELLAESLGVPDIHMITLNPALEGMIVPSKFYGIAAAGKPVLFIGDVQGEIAGLVRRLECGTAIASGDTTSGVEYILRMRASRGLSLRQGDNARRAFEVEFTKEDACARWTTLLKEISQN